MNGMNLFSFHGSAVLIFFRASEMAFDGALPVPIHLSAAPPGRGKIGSRAALPAISEQSTETRIK